MDADEDFKLNLHPDPWINSHVIRIRLEQVCNNAIFYEFEYAGHPWRVVYLYL